MQPFARNELPGMMSAYAQASGAEREMLLITFTALTDVVFNGLGVIESLLIGVWWLGIGLVLQHERRVLGIATSILGAASLLAGAGTVFDIEALVAVEGVTFLLSPIWALWLGIVIWRGAEKSEQRVETTTAV